MRAWVRGSLDREGRVDLSDSDVAEGHFRVGLHLDNVLGVALGRAAGTGLASIEPLHEVALAPPDAHGENHAASHGVAHHAGATDAHVVVGVGSLAVLVVDEVDLGRALDIDHGALDELVVLDVVAVHLSERAALVGHELRHDGELAGGVDLELLAAAVEACHVVAVVVPSAAGLVADARLGAVLASASDETGLGAGVRGDVGRSGVRLPDIHLVTADSLALDVAL